MGAVNTESTEYKWRTLVRNYEDFQNELDNTATGIDVLKDLYVEFHKFEVCHFVVTKGLSVEENRLY